MWVLCLDSWIKFSKHIVVRILKNIESFVYWSENVGILLFELSLPVSHFDYFLILNLTIDSLTEKGMFICFVLI